MLRKWSVLVLLVLATPVLLYAQSTGKLAGRVIDVATGDGRVYYVDYARGRLGRLDPQTGEVREWVMPSGAGARPYGMAVDAQDRIWFVETGPRPNRLVGFRPDTGAFFSITPIPTGAGSVRHMDYHAPTGTVWFGTDANTIGRARLGD